MQRSLAGTHQAPAAEPAVGPSLVLKYFHDEAHRRAYEFRCGHASLDDGLIRSGFGAWSQLLEQIRRQPV